MMRAIQQAIFIVLLILLLAALPFVIEVNPIDRTVATHLDKFAQMYQDFFKTLINGGLGTYTLGNQERNIAADISSYFLTSLLLLVSGVTTAVIIGLLFGVFLSRFKLVRTVNLVLNILSAIPDFILIIFSLVLAISIYEITGTRIISLRPDGGALNFWFPILLVGLAPTLYMFKLIAIKYYEISSEDYIRTAVAKGLKVNYINFQHIYKNIEPYIIAELTKIVSIAIGNLFIIEYLLNVPGLTRFIFLSYQFQPVAIGLFSLLLVSLLVYCVIRLLLYLFKRGLIYE
ncbi:ABC transporter permease subunit [Bacillus rubiinfantis]|uniref:ABC transporter permease subunit n=1 Tax=Bacillus rubiinfantis TaxID=1499680 RepID=UPI0005A6A0D6|nr:ABC transporter permease subunit [Bacillus rubiinfantis]